MSSKHASAPWFNAPEATQASLMLEAVQEEIAVPPSSQQPIEFQDLPSMSGDSSDTPPAKKPKPDDGAPSM